MSIKITETIERQCCMTADLKKYQGIIDHTLINHKPLFCQYCGQIWVHDKEMGPAGSMEPVLKKLRFSSDCVYT